MTILGKLVILNTSSDIITIIDDDDADDVSIGIMYLCFLCNMCVYYSRDVAVDNVYRLSLSLACQVTRSRDDGSTSLVLSIEFQD